MTPSFDLPLPQYLINRLLYAFSSNCIRARQPLTDGQLLAINSVLRRIEDGATLWDLCRDPDSDLSQLEDIQPYIDQRRRPS